MNGDLDDLSERATIDEGFEFGPAGLAHVERQRAAFRTSRMSAADMQYRKAQMANDPLSTGATRRAEFVTRRRAAMTASIAQHRADAVTDDNFLRVTISVAGRITLPTDLPRLEREARANAVKAAEAQAETLQRELVEHLQLIGGRHINSLWLGNSVQAEIPSGAIDSLWERMDVLDIGVNQPVFESAFNLSLLRTGTLASNAIATGINGAPPGSTRIRIGFIEAGSEEGNWPRAAHPAFDDASPSFTERYERVWDCNACLEEFASICIRWGCWPKSVFPATDLHATFVAGIAAGSIEQGQDSAITTTTERVRRSGMASETTLVHYGTHDCDALGRALQQAATDGVHVVNASVNLGSPCDRTASCGGVNEAINAVFSAGIVTTWSAGNNGAQSGCQLEYPAFRPSVIAVGAMDSSGTTTSYTSLPFASYSASGGMTVNYAAGGLGMHTIAGIGLVAPGDYTLLPSTDSPASYTTSVTSGTSLSAPVVAGGAALFIDGAMRAGMPLSSRLTTNNLLLMGDRWNGVGTSGVSAGPHIDTGMGRFRLRVPGVTPFAGTGPFGWGGVNATILPGTILYRSVGSTGPETGVVSWRWVTSAFPPMMDGIDVDYFIRAVDKCLEPGKIVARDESFDLRKRISLSQSELCPTAGNCRCIEMQIHMYAAPSTGAQITTTDFFANVPL